MDSRFGKSGRVRGPLMLGCSVGSASSFEPLVVAFSPKSRSDRYPQSRYAADDEIGDRRIPLSGVGGIHESINNQSRGKKNDRDIAWKATERDELDG